jgi:hypothetical protein
MLTLNVHCLRVEGLKEIYQANNPRKQAVVAILMLNKVDFKPKLVRKDKEGHFILIKGRIYQEEITIINLYFIMFNEVGLPTSLLNIHY